MTSEIPLNPMSLDQKPSVPSSTDAVDSETKMMNGNTHELDPLFDDGDPPPLPNGDGHASAPQPEIPTKAAIAEVDAFGRVPVTGASASGAVPPSASEDAAPTGAVAEPVEPLATTSVPPPIEQPASDERDENPAASASAFSEAALPSHTVTDQGADGMFEEKMDTTEDSTPLEAKDAQATGVESSTVNQAVEAPQQDSVRDEPDTVGMVDASAVDAASSSLVRPREEAEDEDEDGPSAKRLKVDTADATAEFKVPEVPASAAATENGTAVAAPSDNFLNTRSIDNQPMTKSQNKFLLDAVRKTKKTKAAKWFLKPVDAEGMGLPTYYTVITNPMDLGTVEQKLKDNEFGSVDETMSAIDRIVKNSVTFNGIHHGVTVEGMNMRAYFVKLMDHIPTGEKARTEATEVKKVPPKPAPVRRESRTTARSPTNKAGDVHQPFLNSDGMPLIRRDSSNPDRPKREIHRPPPRDLPYSVRPKKKKHQLELKFCETVLQEMLKKKYQSFSYPFLQPVDPVALNIPNYFKIIKKPMDVGTIGTNLKNGVYPSAKEFYQDMKLVFTNCYKFNPVTDEVYKMGKSFEELFDKQWEGKKEYMEENRRTSEPASSDEEEYEEDGEDEVDEESKAAVSDHATVHRIIEIQKQITALTAEAMSLTQGSAAAVAPKAKKSAKPKAGGSSKVKRHSTGAAPVAAVKAAPPKKRAKKPRKLTLEQKREVSDAIQTLNEGEMRKAVQIIRNGVPALRVSFVPNGFDIGATDWNEQDVHDDELELDIDDIPDEVLSELHDFVKKLRPKHPVEHDDDYEEPHGIDKPASVSRKKNKPMSAREQESKIARVQEQLQKFHNHGSGSEQSPPRAADDSESGRESDSESSEEE